MNNRAEVLENLGDYGSADFTVRKDSMFVSCASYDTHINSHRAIVRNDNDFAISVVGKNYNPVNHPDAFKTAENVIMLSDLTLKALLEMWVVLIMAQEPMLHTHFLITELI
tara:strand:+ start:1809 stop:2141 length:333 start_codon:yes stop_codon:yes gene_type:complete